MSAPRLMTVDQKVIQEERAGLEEKSEGTCSGVNDKLRPPLIKQ